MARGRMISKSLGASERFYKLHHDEQFAPGRLAEFAGELFMLIVASSDDFGRFHGDAFTVKMQVFPVSPRSIADFDAALDALHAVGLIERYPINGSGKVALQITDFEPHQQGLQRRTHSKFPPPPSASGKVDELHRSSESFSEPPDAAVNVPAERELELEPELEKIQAAASNSDGGKTAGNGKTRGRKPITDTRRARAQTLVDVYRAAAPKLAPVVQLTDKRITTACAALDRVSKLSQWHEHFERLNRSTFCTGGGDRGWVADFEFAVRADTWTKTVEGKYDDRKGNGSARPVRNADEARTAVRERGLRHVTTDDIDIR